MLIPAEPGSMPSYHAITELLFDEATALAVVVTLVASVYLCAAWIIFRRLPAWLHLSQSPERKISSASKIMLFLAATGLGCMLYASFIEPYCLDVTAVHLKSHKVTRPIRILHLSDLHCETTPRLEAMIPQAVAQQKPDLVVFTGDAINSPQALPRFRKCMQDLAAIAPTYAVYGNHDTREWHHLKLYDDTGVKALNGQALTLPIAGAKVFLSGVAVDSEALIDRALKVIPDDAFSIFLYHFPAGILKVAGKNVDLFLTGHTHGGQVRLPFYGAVITRSRTGKRYEAGLYKLKDTYMYVNRGIGMEGGFAPRFRFLAKPELTVIDVCPAI